jgi:hypothetical protein
MVDTESMPWSFRAVEVGDGTWSCQHGLIVFDDDHPTLEEALGHLDQLAQSAQQPAWLFAHWRDGHVQRVREINPQ